MVTEFPRDGAIFTRWKRKGSRSRGERIRKQRAPGNAISSRLHAMAVARVELKSLLGARVRQHVREKLATQGFSHGL